jgi:hypothetical protein
MRNPVLALSLAVLPLQLLASAGCTHSWPHVARNAFAESYWCPVNQIEVSPEPGSDRIYRVAGCGLEVTYDCSGTGDSMACRARQRIEYEATDATSHGASLEEDTSSNHAMSREAAVVSAVHDLQCDRASLQVAGADPNGFANIVDGCGQRVTYEIVDAADQPTAGPVKKHTYVVLRRSPLAAPAAPPPSASPPPPAPPPAPAPAPPPAPSATPPPATSAAPPHPSAAAPAHAPSAAPPPIPSSVLNTQR